ncbi:hypothetical protein HUG17_9885 [Dermatophagoides farinae]|uniref:Uncharacterized protein n=1 Tax=Dermatophagoides farinae TaxID=6954 RepID=A0A9D4SHZ1_DERFA|nr:hypothetical protein HUG17_9885 [Dermatophagoides farinae]
MATTRSSTRDLIKTAKAKVDYVFTALSELQKEIAGELDSGRMQQASITKSFLEKTQTNGSDYAEALSIYYDSARPSVSLDYYPNILDFMTPAMIKKLDFKFPEQPGVTFSNNHEIPIVHSTINPFTSGYTFPSTSGQTQSEFVRPGMEPVFRKSFNMKWADKLIHQTDAEDGQIITLREKPTFSLGLIAGIDGPQYHQAYNILTRYYSASFPLQQKLNQGSVAC